MVTPKELLGGKKTDSNRKFTHAMVDVSEVGNTSEIVKAQNVDIYIVKLMIFDIR